MAAMLRGDDDDKLVTFVGASNEAKVSFHGRAKCESKRERLDKNR